MNRDTIILMALELDLPDILSLCLSNSNYNRYICANNSFWQKKIYKDFGITTTSITAKEDYQRDLVYRKELFEVSLGNMFPGYDSLIPKQREIFNQEYRKVFMSDEPDKLAESLLDKFTSAYSHDRDYYYDKLLELME